MKVIMNKTECSCGIQQFYDNVAMKLGYNVDKVNYDCTKLKVSNKIFDEIYEFYKVTQAIGMDSMGMMWVCYGPKCDDELKEYEIDIEDGFIIENIESR